MFSSQEDKQSLKMVANIHSSQRQLSSNVVLVRWMEKSKATVIFIINFGIYFIIVRRYFLNAC